MTLSSRQHLGSDVPTDMRSMKQSHTQAFSRFGSLVDYRTVLCD